MTVKELIKALQKGDQNAEVQFSDGKGYFTPIKSVVEHKEETEFGGVLANEVILRSFIPVATVFKTLG
jgi:hypothetical protein